MYQPNIIQLKSFGKKKIHGFFSSWSSPKTRIWHALREYKLGGFWSSPKIGFFIKSRSDFYQIFSPILKEYPNKTWKGLESSKNLIKLNFVSLGCNYLNPCFIESYNALLLILHVWMCCQIFKFHNKKYNIMIW